MLFARFVSKQLMGQSPIQFQYYMHQVKEPSGGNLFFASKMFGSNFNGN